MSGGGVERERERERERTTVCTQNTANEGERDVYEEG